MRRPATRPARRSITSATNAPSGRARLSPSRGSLRDPRVRGPLQRPRLQTTSFTKGKTMSEGQFELRQRVSRPIADAADLRRWLASCLQLKFPPAGVCPGHCSPFDYLHHAHFEPSADAVVWAPRGGGKTRLGAVATLLDLLHKPGCTVR